MKRTLSIVTLFIFMMLSGCGLLEGVNDTLNYVNDATSYVQNLNDAAQELPGLAEQAVKDTAALSQLDTKLEQLKTDINTFNELNPPSIADGLHEKIVSQNEKLESSIDDFHQQVKKGNVTLQGFQNSEIMTTINEITKLQDQIQQLGN
ncbi:DUF6376 family protein [Peribacillus alkalitolerans]|uniref:DUF6376 family protein n=1 Tax=Peribacillus alkalitolerans TaxID=1550385 RepID=UPI0013D7F4B6|nr:DUF6376 family protein [Peribacillus alkalitolerans]